jgi:hypothetical protein
LALPPGVDHPALSEQWSQPCGEDLWLNKQGQISVEVQLTLFESAFKCSNELAAEHPAEHFDGKKECLAGFDPVGVIERQPASGNDAMDMRVELELLIPGVQHTEEANFRAEVSWIAGDFEQSFRTGTEQ